MVYINSDAIVVPFPYRHSRA